MAPAWSQQTNLGRYVPPTMTGGGGRFNSNQWNNQGGFDYNLPGSYGSPLGQGQFAPMPQMFQQYLQQMGQFGGGMGGGFDREGFSGIMQEEPSGIKDGTPLRIGPSRSAPTFTPRQFQQYSSRSFDDNVPGTGMSQMDFIRRGDPALYNQLAAENQAGYDAQLFNEWRRQFGGG